MFDDKSRYLDRFGVLLAATVTAIVMLSLFDFVGSPEATSTRVRSLITSALVGGALLLALRASGLSRRWQRLADGLVFVVIATLVVVVLSNFSESTEASATPAPIVLVVLAALAPVVVVRRLLQHRTVSLGTLLGAISAYLLIPVAFYYVFLSVDTYENSHFFGTSESTTSFMYFSLTSLTTLGYGDLTPVTDLGRLLSTSEAVVGQVFLVTFVAMIVGLMAQSRRGRFAAADDDGDQLAD